MPYCQKCGAELPEKANFCPACGIPALPEAEPIEKHRVIKVAGKPKVVVSNFAPGSVIVKPGQQGEVTVDLELKAPEDLDCSVSPDGNIVTVRCRARAGFWGWSSYVFGTGPRATVLVSVPSEADLDLETRAGRVAVAGVKGTIKAESSAGKVSIKDCQGAVKARTRAGSVSLENVDGAVTARSSAGSIDFTGSLSKGEHWFRTSVGSIDILLKGQPDLTIEASTALGSIRCIPELTGAHYRLGRHVGRIGSGTGRLIVETKTGSIRIRH